MTNLYWLQNWFFEQYIRKNENQCSINISTSHQNKWIVEIDLNNSEYHNFEMNPIINKKSEFNWYSIEILNHKFVGKGDPSKLDLIVGEFREFIGKQKTHFSIIKDYLISGVFNEFLFESETKDRLFMHYTKEESAVQSIIKFGFNFVFSFDRTTVEISNDSVDLIYKHDRHKSYGDWLLIIAISKKVYLKYLEILNKISNTDATVSEILSEKQFYINEEGDSVYTLHHKFVKGYINYKEGTIVKNPEFYSEFDCDYFLENINKIK